MKEADDSRKASRWRRKTKEELAVERARQRRRDLNPMPPALIAIMLAVVVTIGRALFPTRLSRRPPLPLEDALYFLILTALPMWRPPN